MQARLTATCGRAHVAVGSATLLTAGGATIEVAVRHGAALTAAAHIGRVAVAAAVAAAVAHATTGVGTFAFGAALASHSSVVALRATTRVATALLSLAGRSLLQILLAGRTALLAAVVLSAAFAARLLTAEVTIVLCHSLMVFERVREKENSGALRGRRSLLRKTA